MEQRSRKLRCGLTTLLLAAVATISPLVVFAQDPDAKQKEIPKTEQPKDQKGTPADQAQQPTPTPPQAPSFDQPAPPGGGAAMGGGGAATPGGSATSQGSTTTLNPGGGAPAASAGGVLADSNAVPGVDVQRRAPLSVDPRIRGYHVGQVVSFADWAFWTPARIDLDTALGKIDPDNIANITVIKGPYSVRYGPGFAFLDIDTLTTPRSKDDCFEVHGSSSVIYRTNNAGWTGRQYIWGGGKDWGFRLGYDLLAGDDYTAGSGHELPSSYNSQNVDFAIGFDLTEHSRLELKYLRQMQHDVEYPGLLTDINQENTDGLTARYHWNQGAWFDRLTVDGWYNLTSFTGDSSHAGKRKQIPQLNAILTPPGPNSPNQKYFDAGGNQIRLDLDTDAQQRSWGFREAMTWGEDKGVRLTIGTDITIVGQQYNEFDSFDFSPPVNFGIPRTQSIDPGLFIDGGIPIGELWQLKAGTRIDCVSTDLLHLGPSMLTSPSDPDAYFNAVGPDAFNTQHFMLLSVFGTAEYKLTDEITLSGGYGYAQRPPMLTELYTGGAFFGLIQNGFNAIYGDPNLSPEQLNQFDLGITAKDECFRAGAHGFFALVNDYITYRGNTNFEITAQNVIDPATGQPFRFPGDVPSLQTVLRKYRYFNTSRATLVGFELNAECDVLDWLTPFATAGYVQGRDLEISEPLPGFAPLEGRFGLRIHDPQKEQKWSMEIMARAVAAQDLVAASLGESPTPGFMVVNVRGYWQARDNLLLTAGVENLGDRNYQEHLDLRTGLGVFQPGINFTFGVRVSY